MTTAIDFSDLTGVKPQQPKPQGFQTPPVQQNNAQGFYSPDKIPEKKEQAQPSSMGYPTQQTPAGDELMQLFPTPVLICPYPVDYTKELEWINNTECRKENQGGDGGGQKIHLCLIDQS